MKTKPVERLLDEARQKRKSAEMLREIVARTRTELDALLVRNEATDYEKELRLVRLDQATPAITDADAAKRIAELQAQKQAADTRSVKDSVEIKAKTDLLHDAESRAAQHENEAATIEAKAKDALIEAIEAEMVGVSHDFLEKLDAFSGVYKRLHTLDYSLSKAGGRAKGFTQSKDRIEGFVIGKMEDLIHERGNTLAFCGSDLEGEITQQVETILAPIRKQFPEITP